MKTYQFFCILSLFTGVLACRAEDGYNASFSTTESFNDQPNSILELILKATANGPKSSCRLLEEDFLPLDCLVIKLAKIASNARYSIEDRELANYLMAAITWRHVYRLATFSPEDIENVRSTIRHYAKNIESHMQKFMQKHDSSSFPPPSYAR